MEGRYPIRDVKRMREIEFLDKPQREHSEFFSFLAHTYVCGEKVRVAMSDPCHLSHRGMREPIAANNARGPSKNTAALNFLQKLHLLTHPAKYIVHRVVVKVTVRETWV